MLKIQSVGLPWLYGVLLATLAAWVQAAPPAGALERPSLQTQQGQYFRWAMPQGWTSNETSNGVDLLAPDGITLVSSALLHGGFGNLSPRDFLLMIMQQVNPTAQIEDARPLPSQPGIWGPWLAEDFALSAVHQGTPVRMRATVGLSSGYGRYSASMTLYQAPAGTWEQAKLWLPAVAQAITATNAPGLAGQNQVMLPRNNPLDNSGLIESWREKGLSEDRIAQGQREGTMGYTRQGDPDTGQSYELPLEAYDATLGGYRNPNRPGELLVPLPPGY